MKQGLTVWLYCKQFLCQFLAPSKLRKFCLPRSWLTVFAFRNIIDGQSIISDEHISTCTRLSLAIYSFCSSCFVEDLNETHMECKSTGSKAAEALCSRDLPLLVCLKRTMVSFAADGFSGLELHGKSMAVAYIRSFIMFYLHPFTVKNLARSFSTA